jgi:hypothetical protein
MTPALLQANRELSEEAGEVYYKNGIDVYLGYEHSDPLSEFANWRHRVVGDLAIYLRDVRLHISFTNRSDDEQEWTIHIKFDPHGNGITAEGFRGVFKEDATYHGNGGDVYEAVEDLKHLRIHARAIEARRVQLGQQGEAIMDFVLANPDDFRNACFGPPVKRVYYFDEAGNSMIKLVPCDYCDPDRHPSRHRYW